MAQLALTLAGAAIGSAGGPMGMQIGAAIGSMAGAELENLLNPASKTNSPKPSDKRVQVSTYGQVFTEVAGTMRVSGNIFWSTGIHAVQTSTGGGGGGFDVTKGVLGGVAAGSGAGTDAAITWVYYASFAVSWGKNLFGGPISGILRIWADGRLIWDNRPKSKGGVRNTGTASLHHYLGSDTQLPNPLMQSFLGVEFTPAYRGQAYSLFHMMDLTRFGNRIPNLTAEVMTSADQVYPVVAYAEPFSAGQLMIDEARNYVIGYRNGSFYRVNTLDAEIVMVSTPGETAGFPNHAALGYDGFLYYGGATFGHTPIYKVDIDTMAIVDQTPNTVYFPDQLSSSPLHDYLIGSAYSTILNEMFVICKTTTNSQGIKQSAMRFIAELPGAGHFNAVADPRSVTVVGTTTTFDIWALDGDGTLTNYVCTDLGAAGTIAFANSYPAIAGSGVNNLCYQDSDHSLIIGGGSDLLKFSLDSRTIVATLGSVGGATWNWDQGPSNSIMVGSHTNGAYVVNTNELSLIEDVTYLNYGLAYITLFVQIVYDAKANALWVNGAQFLLDRMSPNGVLVADIAEAIMEKGGLTAGQIDKTDVPDVTHGFALTRQAPARAGLLPLATGYFFDIVESDFKMTLVKRGHPPVATLTKDEVGAYAAGTKRPDPFMPVRMPEQEIPRRISVKYLNKGALYQDGLQSAQRIIVGTDMQSTTEQSVDLAIAMGDDEARSIATRLLDLAWTRRDSAPLSYSRKWLLLNPADVIAFQKDGKTYTLRLTKTDLGLNGVISADTEFDDPDIYPSLAIGVGGTGLPPEPGTGDVISPIIAFFLDIVMLRDADDNSGFYWGVAPLDENLAFEGGASFKSIDGGNTYDPFETSTTPLTAGATTNALASAPGGRWSTWDRVNTLTVRMFSGAMNLVSATSELAVLNGANAALVGGEVIGFLNATDNGDGTWTLDTLVRARRGSDGMLTHAIGDRFILLSAPHAGIVDLIGGDLNLARQYKSVALGDNSLPASFTTFTDRANRLRPYAVMAIKGARSGGDITLTWIRRSRLAGTWNLVTSSALGEASEAYEIDILNGSTVVRTITASTPTAVYTSAQQTTDFGSPQASVSLKAYQINATVGRGFESAATV